MLERAGIATNPLTADDNGLDLNCQMPALPLTSKQKQDIETGSQFEWVMNHDSMSIQVKSGSSSVKVRDLHGWDVANKSSPLGARIMAVWLDHKDSDSIWVFDPDAISSITKRLRANQKSLTLSAKAYRNAAVEFDYTKPEVLGRYLWLWFNCPVALKVWEKDIFYCAQIPTWPSLQDLEDISYEFLRWKCHDKGTWALQDLYDEGGSGAGDAFLECRNIFESFYSSQGFDECLNNHAEAESTVMDRLRGDVWVNRPKYQHGGPANQWWTPPAVDRKSVVEQFNKLYGFLRSENE